jgi:hypothetical protein
MAWSLLPNLAIYLKIFKTKIDMDCCIVGVARPPSETGDESAQSTLASLGQVYGDLLDHEISLLKKRIGRDDPLVARRLDIELEALRDSLAPKEETSPLERLLAEEIVVKYMGLREAQLTVRHRTRSTHRC